MSLPSAFITCSTNARLVAILVLGVELGLALVQQDRLRLALARGREDDATVRQVVRRDIVALASATMSEAITRRSAVGGEVVFPDVPGGLVFLVLRRCKGPRMANTTFVPSKDDLEVADVVEALAIGHRDR